MISTLRFRIAALIVGLLILTALAVLLSVWVSTYRFAQHQIERDLDFGLRVLQQVLAERESQLINSAGVLAADFGFRQAVASNDVATITSALENHGERIHADMMAIVNLEKKVQVASLDDLKTLELLEKSIPDLGRVGSNGVSLILPLNGRAFQAVMVVVRAPRPIAIAVIGFEINASLASSLKQITGLEISFLMQQAGQDSPDLLSTINNITAASLQNSLAPSWSLPYSNEILLHSTSRELYLGDSGKIEVFLTDDLRRVFDEFDRLQTTILMIAIVGIALALLAGLIFSKQLIRPLSQLVMAAKSIAAGQYQQNMAIKGAPHEVTVLFSAFDDMQTNLQDREQRILYQATHDITTGLINRQKFISHIQECIEDHKVFTLIGFSVSNFRQINDMFGPVTADKCLISLSNRLGSLVPVLARLGGGNFAAKIEGRIDPQSLNRLADVARISAETDGINVNFEIHIGLVEFPADVVDAVGLVRRLDIAVDSARYAHRGIHYYLAGQEEDYVKRLKIVDELRLSIRDHGRGLQMYYQPKLNLTTGRVSRVEALIRWIHPEDGFIPPDVFIPLAEQSGLIVALTEWVVASVTQQAAYWRQLNFDVQVAINLSAQDISRADMLELIRHQLGKHKISSACLAFEITESEVMRQPEQAIERLKSFREAGFDLAIDDFGTGYSSLSQLKNMPVTELKIDREFVMNLAVSEEDQTIVKSTIELAHQLDLEVIAEGVEDIEALKLLRQWGCQWAQGYFIARPMAAGDIVGWLDQWHAQNQNITPVGVGQ